MGKPTINGVLWAIYSHYYNDIYSLRRHKTLDKNAGFKLSK